MKKEKEKGLADLKRACIDHLQNKISTEELQWYVRKAESSFTSVFDDNYLDYLINVEGELESILFMVEEESQKKESDKIVHIVLDWIESIMSRDAGN